jgi:radical SAM superfamily enzyme YgiQ (UPF0313 family)
VDGIAFRHIDKTIIKPSADQSHNCRSASLPAFGLLRYGKLKVYPINWRRGCPLKCEFCAVRKNPGKESALDLLKAVRHCHEKFGADKFFIVDDRFGGNLINKTERAELVSALNLLTAYQKKINRHFSFSAQLELNASGDTELLFLLRQAGVNTVRLSYDSSVIEAPDLNDKTYHHTVKGYSREWRTMVHYTRQWRQAGFIVHGMFIFNYPKKTGAIADWPDEAERQGRLSAETKKIIKPAAEAEQAYGLSKLPTIKNRVRAVKEFIKWAGINTVQVALAVPSPGTALRERLEKSGRLFPVTAIGWEYYDGQFPLYQPSNCEAEELWQGAQDIMSGFYGLRNFLRQASFNGWPFRRNRLNESVRRDFSAKLKRAKAALNQ